MLVTRRGPGESILIGEDVEVQVLACGQGRVKLGIRAPRHVRVIRGESQKTLEQNLVAASAIRASGFRVAGKAMPAGGGEAAQFQGGGVPERDHGAAPVIPQIDDGACARGVQAFPNCSDE